MVQPFLDTDIGDVTLVGVRAAKEGRERDASNPVFAAVRNEARSSPNAYFYATAIGVAITALASLLSRHIDLTNLVMLYLLGVVFAAVRLGRGPGVLLSFVSVAAFDFFFIPPQLSLFSVSDTAVPADFLRDAAADLARRS